RHGPRGLNCEVRFVPSAICLPDTRSPIGPPSFEHTTSGLLRHLHCFDRRGKLTWIPTIKGCMRLGFDLDGTLADLHGAIAREARDLFPDIDLNELPRSASPAAGGDDQLAITPSEPLRATHALSRRQQRKLWAAV